MACPASLLARGWSMPRVRPRSVTVVGQAQVAVVLDDVQHLGHGDADCRGVVALGLAAQGLAALAAADGHHRLLDDDFGPVAGVAAHASHNT